MKKERIDKILGHMGIGSRKEIKEFAKKGLIKINGSVIKSSDFKVDPESDIIEYMNSVIEYREFIYIMMNKPQGLISSTDDPRESLVIDLLDDYYKNFKPFPIGRLDKDTEGLLLISNDGKLAHDLLSPKKKVGKTYYVQVMGYVDEEHVEKFKEGILLDDGYNTLPANLEILVSDNISKVNLTIMEGKYHQVKRMFGALGMRVTYLKRISMGELLLDLTLEPGEYRELREEEINLLKRI